MGVQCVIAKSFARIFFRNSINNGLLLIEQPDLYDDMKEGDEITVVMNEHVDYNGKGISDCFSSGKSDEYHSGRRTCKSHA